MANSRDPALHDIGSLKQKLYAETQVDHEWLMRLVTHVKIDDAGVYMLDMAFKKCMRKLN